MSPILLMVRLLNKIGLEHRRPSANIKNILSRRAKKIFNKCLAVFKTV